MATLLDIRVRDARVRLERMAAAGLLRWVGTTDHLGHLPAGLAPEELAQLELCELTREGLRALAASLGLSLAAAERLRRLAGGRPEQPTRTRWPLVRTLALAHTLGADAVFVALHVALSDGRENGLVRWDNAAAAMRGHCRPDGYGVCRLDGRDVGIFLEYDRGTESARDYVGKWNAYCAYRDSGRAAAAGRVPLPILVTTNGWVAGHPQGLLGPIWCTPESPRRRSLGARISWYGGMPASAATASRLLDRTCNILGRR